MKLLKTLSIAVTLLLLMLPVASAQTKDSRLPDYDAVKDFSLQSNPNGVWSYGWQSTLRAALTLYPVADTNCYPGFGMSAWHEEGPCSVPFVVHNDTDKQICIERDRICWPTTYLGLHPGRNGELSVVRWTAPSSGRFLLEAAFEGLDADNGGTDVHILIRNKISLLSGPINIYQWPLTFKRIVHVSAGDTLDIVVGFGKDGNYYNDSTGIRFKLTRLGK